MIPDNAGDWALVCRTNDHYSAGMQAKYKVLNTCGRAPEEKTSGKTRRYYIAAVKMEWDYAPTGMDALDGKKLDQSELVTFSEPCDLYNKARICVVVRQKLHFLRQNVLFPQLTYHFPPYNLPFVGKTCVSRAKHTFCTANLAIHAVKFLGNWRN